MSQNREIKFRAWDKEENRMVKPFSFWVHPSLGIQIKSIWVGHESVVGDPDDFIVQQFTGLKDKNGKEIYEGDILNPGLREVMFGDFISLDTDGIPFSQGNGFYTITHELTLLPMPFSFAHRQSEGCEIIGNIYSNPELIKDKS